MENLNDIETYPRYFVAEVLERNGDMEYTDKTSFVVPSGVSLEQTTQEVHLNWRNELDEDWQDEYETWGLYYSDQIDESEKGAYWSDHTLVFYPSTKETTQADIETKANIEKWWSDSRCNYADMYNTAELYLDEAAKYLAKELGLELDEAKARVLFNLMS